MNLPENPLNEYMELGREWFNIVGLMRPQGEIVGFSKDDIVLALYAIMHCALCSATGPAPTSRFNSASTTPPMSKSLLNS